MANPVGARFYPFVRSRGAALAVGLWVAWAATTPAAAQPCTGDCSGDQHVEVDELITCVNIALEMQPLSRCPPCNAGSDAAVGIDDLVAAVDRALHRCPSVPPRCGDGFTGSGDGEECDDGNMLGGDGCAANCTRETRRLVDLDSLQSMSIVESGSFPVTINLVGSQGFITGQPRDTTVMDAAGNVITRPGEIPVVMKAADFTLAPVIITGLLCACVRAIPADDLFGSGNSAAGVIGCGEAGLTDVDYKLSQDHNCTPGCARGLERFGGQAPRGSAFLDSNTAIGLLQDGGVCRESRLPNGDCRFPDYGPDCQPCTDDDADLGTPENVPLTTGVASAALYNVGNQAGRTFDSGSGTPCADDNQCRPGEACAQTCEDSGLPCDAVDCETGDACRSARCEFLCGESRCRTSVQGARFDCDALLGNPTGGLSGAALAAAFPSVDARGIGDNVTTTLYAFE